MPSYVVFDEITDVGPEQIAALAASPMRREIPGRQTDDGLSPFSGLLDCAFRFAAAGDDQPATPQPEPATAPLTAKELAEARENARPQVTKNVKPPDTVRK